MQKLLCYNGHNHFKGGAPALKCPYCGSEYAGSPQYCPACRQPLSRIRRSGSETTDSRAQASRREPRTAGQKWLIGIASALCVLLICFGVYKVVFWASNYRITRLYTRGEYTPTINTVTLDDGRIGHTIVFYGADGDQIFLPELQRSLSISGGVARITIADADWVDQDVSEVEAANVVLSPVLIDEKGMRTQLPATALTVDVPDSPLEVISPAKDGLSIVTARYLLELQVVPGSTVLVNGEDVTDTVDRSGLLSQNVNVYPIGDNVYTILVRTPKHHETRHEITIYREAFDIALELDTNVANTSSNEIMTISGTAEPGATITVETPYQEDSLIHDPETGRFQFIAKFSSFGDNPVRFRASMEGRKDAVISMTVNYKPTLAKYSAKAWKMDYAQLKRLYEQWAGQVFLCKGPVIDTFTENDVSYLVMDVGTEDEQQLVILENRSTTKSVNLGRSYTAYAHVSGRHMYNAEYYPMLTALYVDLTPTS